MIRKIFSIINISLFFMMILLPIYTDAIFLNMFLSYFFSFLWFMLILLIGLNAAPVYFLFASYIAGSIVYHSFGFDSNALIGSIAGISSAFMLYYTRGMDLER
jgi:hypothetical protein